MSDPWYRCYPSNFIQGCFVLTAEQKGVYRTLIDLMYDRGGPIEDSARDLGRISGCSTRKFSAIRDLLLTMPEKLIRTPDGRLFNRRVDRELKGRNIIDPIIGEKKGQTSKDNRGDKIVEKKTTSAKIKDLTQKGQVSVARARENLETIKKEESSSGLSKAERFCNEVGLSLTSDPRHARFITQIVKLEASGIDFDLDLLPIVKERARLKRLPDIPSPNYFAAPAIANMEARKAFALAPAPAFEDTDRPGWVQRLRAWLTTGYWPARYGPLPRLEANRLPLDLRVQAVELWDKQGQHPKEWFCEIAMGFVVWDRVALPRRETEADQGVGHERAIA